MPDARGDGFPSPVYACVSIEPAPVATHPVPLPPGGLAAIARQFSPRYQQHGDRVVTVDVTGLGRLLGPPAVIARELRREAVDRGFGVHVATSGTCTAAILMALSRPGETVVD